MYAWSLLSKLWTASRPRPPAERVCCQSMFVATGGDEKGDKGSVKTRPLWRSPLDDHSGRPVQSDFRPLHQSRPPRHTIHGDSSAALQSMGAAAAHGLGEPRGLARRMRGPLLAVSMRRSLPGGVVHHGDSPNVRGGGLSVGALRREDERFSEVVASPGPPLSGRCVLGVGFRRAPSRPHVGRSCGRNLVEADFSQRSLSRTCHASSCAFELSIFVLISEAGVLPKLFQTHCFWGGRGGLGVP